MLVDRLATPAAGLLLLVGMISGVWKWRAMVASRETRAPLYVDVLHRAALLYACATVVLGALVSASALPRPVNLGAFALCYSFFVITLAVYAFHGWRGRAQTMFAERSFFTGPGMVLLVIAEIGSTAVLVAGSLLPR